ncbi:NOL1/NOP2/sun family protein [Mycobacterium xenopi 3993]|nr:NOL1/NOP2/sun family protein [Mycobacterium xenopi 3993]
MHAHPRWIAQAFADALGPAAGELDALLASDDERPQVHLAARPEVLSARELADAVHGSVGRYSPYAVYLPTGDPAQLPAVRDGLALVQDEGSQLVARALTLAPVDADTGRWLDLCAGQAARPRCWPRWARAAGAGDRGGAGGAPRGAGSAQHRGSRWRWCGSTLGAAGSTRASTGSWSTCRAPAWGRCAVGRRPAGGASPPTSRR